jgi:hypothetical protein
MPKPERRDPAKERSWRRRLRQWQRSGMTGRDFCAAHGLSEASFYAWRREIARRDQEPAAPTQSVRPPAAQAPAAEASVPAFLQVTLERRAPVPSAIEVVLGQGRCLRVGPGFDADLLRQLVCLLEEPAC